MASRGRCERFCQMGSAVRVLYWAELFWPYVGGIEVVGLALVTALQQRGYEVTVITSSGPCPLPAEERHDGVLICRLPFSAWLRRRELAGVRAVVERVAAIKRAIKPHVVHINTTGSSLFSTSAPWTSARPLPWSRCIPQSRLTLPTGTLFRRTLDTAAWVTAVSSATLQAVCSAAPSIASRASVVPNSLPMPSLPAAPLPLHPPRLVCLGRLEAEKGFDLAIAAFARLCVRFPALRLTIAGDGRGAPGPRAASRSAGRRRTGRFLGFASPAQVPELLNAATLVLIPRVGRSHFASWLCSRRRWRGQWWPHALAGCQR